MTVIPTSKTLSYIFRIFPSSALLHGALAAYVPCAILKGQGCGNTKSMGRRRPRREVWEGCFQCFLIRW